MFTSGGTSMGRVVAATTAVFLSVGTVVLLASLGYVWAPAAGCGVLAAIAVGVVVERDRRALAEARNQFAVAFLNSPLGLAIVDADGRLQRTNAAFADLFGLASPGSETALPALFPPAGRDAIAVALHAVSVGRAPGSR